MQSSTQTATPAQDRTVDPTAVKPRATWCAVIISAAEGLKRATGGGEKRKGGNGVGGVRRVWKGEKTRRAETRMNQ
ncbi:hypothetical protein PDJAM_G00097850 [Pangasius djambal]|uniref:Uncharacterized protein n=1 Tax=Pangasius djambal TaxID=1691987 RepID=A0ACC5Z7B1_9TELE|nr:hypothetical protein [Pangasius djambal]